MCPRVDFSLGLSVRPDLEPVECVVESHRTLHSCGQAHYLQIWRGNGGSFLGDAARFEKNQPTDQMAQASEAPSIIFFR